MNVKTKPADLKQDNAVLSAFKQCLKNYELMLMVLPGFVLLLLFHYIPMGGIVIAFKDFMMLDGIWGSPWVGFQHFERLFFQTNFFSVLKNTMVITILKLICGFPAPIILALMLNEVRNIHFKKTVQTLSYLPHFFSWVVLSGIVTMFFSVSGPVNVILARFGVPEPLVFFGDKNLFLGLLVGTAVWQGVGWGTIIYIAALSGIDESLYEAAYIDGAKRWKQTVYISIPCLMPTITTLFILNLGNVLNAGFDQIYNLYNPTVYEVADVLDTFIFRKLKEMEYELGTAVGLFKSVVGLVFVLSANWLVKKMSGDEMGIM